MRPSREVVLRRLRAEDGLGVAEVLIAGVILILGSLAVLGLLANSARSTYRAEQSQVVANRLNLEMEKVRSLAFDDIELQTQATGSPTRTSCSGCVLAAVDSTSALTRSQSFTVGNVKGTINRWVYWNSSACAGATPPSAGCYKIVIIEARPTSSSSGTRSAQAIRSNFFKPAS